MSETGTDCRPVDKNYFDQRGLRHCAVGRHRLPLSPEEALALQAALKAENSPAV